VKELTGTVTTATPPPLRGDVRGAVPQRGRVTVSIRWAARWAGLSKRRH
jgi:hypothetical protein